MKRGPRVHPYAGLVAWGVGLSLTLLVHVIWEMLDRAPPGWDMAYHQLQGWHLLEAARQGTLWGNLSTLSPAYPPLYYLQEALILNWIGDTQFLPLLANFPGFLMLTGATYLLLRKGVRPRWLAGLGASLPLLFPSMAWVSREALLDISLTGFVAIACCLVLESQGFSKLAPTLLFGLACLGGVLTKWTLPLYVVGPMSFGILFLSSKRIVSMRNLCLAGLLVVPVALFYFLPLLGDLGSRYPTTEQSGLIPWQSYPRHGEPGLNNIWGWVYYPRVLASYFLQLPLLGFLVWSLVGVGRSQQPSSDEKAVFRLNCCWLLSGMFLLIFLTPKDPRFFLPLICPLAVLLVWPSRLRLNWVLSLLGIAFLQYLMVSFGTPFGPVRLVSMAWDNEADYQSLQHEWVWFQTFYFDAGGPPDPHDWRHGEILDRIETGSRVGFLPQVVRFNPDTSLLESVRRGRPVELFRLGNDAGWELRMETLDYVIDKTGNQGISFITGFNQQIMDQLQNQWLLLREWPLPDGSQARLWKKP